MAIRVQTIGVGPGVSANLTDLISGLQWSSVNPGGDERCTFNLKRQWFSGAPEVQQGNLLYLTDSATTLWAGRIEENDRAVSDSEYIGVTAYGLGNRLKDTLMTEVYVDRDPGAWTQPPYNEQLRLASAATDFQTIGWQTDGGGFIVSIPGATVGPKAKGALWYTAPPSSPIAKAAYIGAQASVPATWEGSCFFRFVGSDTFVAAGDAELATLDNALHTAAATTALRYVSIQLDTNGAAAQAANGAYRRFSVIGLYGNHGLTTRAIDASTPDGLYVEDIVRNIVGKAAGITISRIDSSLVVVPHFTVKDPTTLEDALTQVNQYAGFDWGTFGPSSPLDTSTNGYFSFTARDTATAHWYARRSDCDDIALQVELATLYDSVDVVYTDPTTSGQQIVTRSATVQALADAGISRKATINGGTLTLAGAQTLGDAFLALTSQQPPARGSIRLSTAPTHYQRGKLPAHFMRADGSNIRVPDVLPSKDALSLSSAPDRRTTFPIKRVTVDCSGAYPQTTVEVDQADDRLSILQARLGLAAQYPGAWPLTLP